LMAIEPAAPRVDPEFLDLAQLLRSVGFEVVGWCGHSSGFLLEVRQRRCLTGESWILASGQDVSIAVARPCSRGACTARCKHRGEINYGVQSICGVTDAQNSANSCAARSRSSRLTTSTGLCM